MEPAGPSHFASIRKTKIVATVGPASSSPEVLRRLILAGVDVFRLNFSHGTHEEHGRAVTAIRRAARELGRAIGILQDLQGPKIRTGPLTQGPVDLQPGQEFVLSTAPVLGTAQRVTVSYPDLHEQVRPGVTVLLADGTLELRVKEVTQGEVVTEVVRGGLLGERKGVNLPGLALPIPALTDKDREDLEFGVGLGVDWVALSFVQRPEDLRMAKELLGRWNADTPVIAKIEKAEAIRNLEALVRASDGVMVARGDLGVELSPEKVPLLQKRIIRLANQAGLPVITATQMLESMMSSPIPTRAEASDVANAILDGTDAVMLSGETAVGQYPIEAVETMVRIALEVEGTEALSYRLDRPRDTIAHSLAHAADALAEEVSARALVVYTQSGYTAQLLSSERPRLPIFAFTSRPRVCNQLPLWFGVFPILGQEMADTERLLDSMQADLLKRGLVSPGNNIVFVRLAPPMAHRRSNLITVRTVTRVPKAGPPGKRPDSVDSGS